MNKEVKQKWLNALRSNDYRQGQLNLHNDDKFCCLGVLTDLYLKENNLSWLKFDEPNNICSAKYPNVPSICEPEKKDLQYLPVEVVNWAELESDDPSANDYRTLSDRNDSGLTFYQIAHEIEENL